MCGGARQVSAARRAHGLARAVVISGAICAGVLSLAFTGSAAAAATGASCQPYAKQPCLFPFPDNRLTANDKASVTGLRLNLPKAAMPVNSSGQRVSPTPYDRNDGFSPGSSVLLHIPQLDTAAALSKTDPVGLLNLAAYRDKNAPVMVINQKTGQRQMVYVQLDQNATTAAQTDLMIVPAAGFKDGQTYDVVLRDLKTAKGKLITAPAWFKPFLAGNTLTRSKLPARQRSQYGRYEQIFKALKRAGVKRASSLYATWNFTVASTKSLTGQMLSIRDAAFKQLGDENLTSGADTGTAPLFQVTSATPATWGANSGTVVIGTFKVPCYLDTCGPTATTGFHYSKTGLYEDPSQIAGNVATADFECVVPSTASPTDPARISLYGHGLLGDMSEVTNTPATDLASEYNMVLCATNWWGLAAPDMNYDTSAIANLNLFPHVIGRLQQGVLNTLFLGRLMRNPAGLASDPTFQQGGQSILDNSELFYDGNSQGGIMGGVTTAVSPDIRRAVLGVTGEDYGNMLVSRSTDFGNPTDLGSFSWLLAQGYALKQQSMFPFALDLMDQLWDHADPDGYVEGLGSNTLANTPKHSVLMDIAYGDHQVSMYAGAAEARAIGADAYEPKGTSASALTPTPKGLLPEGYTTAPAASVMDRQVNDNLFYGLKPAPLGGSFTGSVIEVWDSGPGHTLNPPVGDVPPTFTFATNVTQNQDPHEDPRLTPAAQEQISDFLEPQGTFTNVCDTVPCHSSDYTP